MMELGNMMYGNSRGEYPIQRGEGWEREIERLVLAYRPLANDDRDPLQFENDTFAVMPYYGGECTCGFEERDDQWFAEHVHAADCYQTRLHSEVAAFDKSIGYCRPAALADAFYADSEPLQINRQTVGQSVTLTPRRDNQSAYKKHVEFDEAVRKRLCAELNLSYPHGSASHCTCGLNDAYQKWREADGHSRKCPLVIPNFLYKPTGFEIQWYKYPLRDSYKNMNIDLATFREIVDVCIASLPKPANESAKRPSSDETNHGQARETKSS